ncbi:MAG: helix-turn-helix domain-containing protein [Pirellulales bacterium]
MKFELDAADLRPLVQAVVDETLERLGEADARFGAKRLGLPEAAAAEALGLPRSTLRDLRLAGRTHAVKIGSRYVYDVAELRRLLEEGSG